VRPSGRAHVRPCSRADCPSRLRSATTSLLPISYDATLFDPAYPRLFDATGPLRCDKDRDRARRFAVVDIAVHRLYGERLLAYFARVRRGPARSYLEVVLIRLWRRDSDSGLSFFHGNWHRHDRRREDSPPPPSHAAFFAPLRPWASGSTSRSIFSRSF